MTDPDDIMNYTLSRRKVIFWGTLSKEESDELIGLFEIRSAWYCAWDLVRWTHERYGYKFDGPTAWLPRDVLDRTEELCRKGWGGKFDDQVKKEYEAAKGLPGPPMHAWPSKQVRNKTEQSSKYERVIL